jgi:hypothetical protein
MTRSLVAALALALSATVLPIAGSHAVEGSHATWDRREVLAKVNTWGKAEKGTWYANEAVDDGLGQLSLRISAKKKPSEAGMPLEGLVDGEVAVVGSAPLLEDKLDQAEGLFLRLQQGEERLQLDGHTGLRLAQSASL